MNGQFLVYPIKDEEALEAMWKHLKSTLIRSLEFYVKLSRKGTLSELRCKNCRNTSSFEWEFASFPYAYAFLTQDTQNPLIPLSSCTPYESPQIHVLNDMRVNLRVTNEQYLESLIMRVMNLLKLLLKTTCV